MWIHGGDFAVGSIADYNPAPLMDQEIVFVQMQYRLGVLGRVLIQHFNNTV